MEVNANKLAELMQGGWSDLEKITEPPPPSPEQMDEQYRMDKILHDAFTTPTGAEALQHLREMTIEKPAFNPALGLVGILQGFSREGQDSLVHYIEGRIKRAELGPPSEQAKQKK